MRKTQLLINKHVYLGLSIRFKYNCNIWLLVWLCKTKIRWKCKTLSFVAWIQTASLHMYKQMKFTKILQKMLKKDLGPLPKGKKTK